MSNDIILCHLISVIADWFVSGKLLIMIHDQVNDAIETGCYTTTLHGT